MTKAKYPSPKYWVDIALCEIIYKSFEERSSKYKLAPPVPGFSSRYSGVLESILGGIQLKGSLLGLDIVEVATSYFVRLTKSQAFLDANKRMAVIITNVFLLINGYVLEISPNELVNLALLLSKDKGTSVDASIKILAPIFRKHIKANK